MPTAQQAAEAHEQAVSNIEKMFGGGEESAPEPVATPEEQQQQEAPAETETAEAEATGEEPTGKQPEEEIEVEIDGETYLVPKKISDRFIQHADYTKKTMDIAELRRTLSAEREMAAVEKAFNEAVAGERKQLGILEAQLEQFKQVNWDQIEDAGQLMRLGEQRNRLREAKAEMEEAIKAKRGQFDAKVKELGQQAIESGQKYVEQKVKGFNDSSKQELFAYGLNEGYTRDELDRLVDPRLVVTLWKAAQWDRLQASRPAVSNKATQAAPVVRPGATQRGPSRIQQLDKRFKDAKGATAKKRSAEDFFTAKFGG